MPPSTRSIPTTTSDPDDPLRRHRSSLPTFLYPLSFAPPLPNPLKHPKPFLLHPYTLYFFGLVNAIIAGAVLPASGLVYGWWTNGITDAEGTSRSQSTRSGSAGWVMTVLGVVCLVTSWLFLMCFSAASDTLTASLRRSYVSAVLSQDQAFFDRYGSGEIASRAGKDINTVRTSFGEKMGYIFWSIGTLLASIIPSFIIAARLAGVVISCLPFALLIILLGSYFVDRSGSRVSLLEGRSASTIEGILSSVRIVQAFDMAPNLVRRLDEGMLKRLQHLGIGRSYARAFLQAGMYFTLFLGFSVSFWFAGIEIVNGLSVGYALTVFWNVINAIFALANILPHIASLADASVAIKALRRQIEREPFIDIRSDAGLSLCDFDDPARDWEPSFEFEGITFAYPSRPGIKALDDVSFEIEAGKFTALVGYSGSGKSTSAALILREYDPGTANLPNACDVLDEEERRKQNAELEEDEKSRKAAEADLEKADEEGIKARNRIQGEGTVLFAGRDIRSYKLSWLRKQIAVVSQSPQLFSASIFENVAMGLTGTEWEYRPETDGVDGLASEARQRVGVIRGKVEEALRKAQAWDFVVKLPQGIDTIINGGRAQLSGGQAQRVALARAIIRKPAVLLLDEATSALDTASENKIKEILAVEQKERGMTLICIAHRISTVISADKVIVMSEGRNVDEGTYEELLDSKRPDQTFRNITLANQVAQASPDDIDEKSMHQPIPSRSSKALTRLDTIDDADSGVFSTTTTCVPGLNAEASTPPPFPRTASSSMRPRRPDLREVMSGRGSNFGRMDHLGEAPVSMAARTDQADRDDIVAEKVTKAINPTPDAAAEYVKAKRYSKFTLIRRFGTALGRMKWWFVAGIFLSTLAGAGWPIEGWMVGEVVDEIRVVGDDDAVRSAANKWAFWFLILAIADGLVLFANGVAFELSGGHLMRSLKRDAMLALTRQEIAFFDTSEETDAGALTSTVTSGPTEVTNASGLVLSQVLIAFWNIIGSIILGFVLSWRVTIVALPPVLVLFVSGWLNVAMLDKYEAENAGPAARTASFITENVNIIRTIASLGRERAAMRTFDSLNQTARRTITYLALGATGFAISQAMVIFLQALLFYWGGELIARDQVSVSALYACFEAVIIAGFAASRVFTFVGDFGRAFSAFGTIQSWLDRKPKIPAVERGEGNTPGGQLGDIVLHGIEMRYPRRPNHPALKDISLTFEAGKTHALCGSSGSGKSSILALVLRFYEATQGNITFGGRDSQSIPLNELRSRCAYVSQDPQLFEGSVRWNLLLGALDPDAVTQKELEEVCEQACILDFVRNLKDGFETEIGMKGAQLSGGERQRLCIARALLRRPEVLLLDEATSALDARSELAVQRALDNASKGRTTITLAHRLSTIRKADTISVIEDGAVREQGSHDELIKMNGRYVELIQAQL